MNEPRLTIDRWRYADHFGYSDVASPTTDDLAAIQTASYCVTTAQIAAHPFFSLAHRDARALIEWAKQEAVITNHFSQTLCFLLSTVANVHVRSILMPVVVGEHNEVKDGIASEAHPSLLAKLLNHLDINPHEVFPEKFTVAFADFLSDSVRSPLYAFGVFGVGNEALLIPEYNAIRAALSQHYSRGTGEPFFSANINADVTHTALFELAACRMFRNSHDHQEYIRGAHEGVASRKRYYDDLLEHCLRMIG